MGNRFEAQNSQRQAAEAISPNASSQGVVEQIRAEIHREKVGFAGGFLVSYFKDGVANLMVDREAPLFAESFYIWRELTATDEAASPTKRDVVGSILLPDLVDVASLVRNTLAEGGQVDLGSKVNPELKKPEAWQKISELAAVAVAAQSPKKENAATQDASSEDRDSYTQETEKPVSPQQDLGDWSDEVAVMRVGEGAEDVIDLTGEDGDLMVHATRRGQMNKFIDEFLHFHFEQSGRLPNSQGNLEDIVDSLKIWQDDRSQKLGTSIDPATYEARKDVLYDIGFMNMVGRINERILDIWQKAAASQNEEFMLQAKDQIAVLNDKKRHIVDAAAPVSNS